MLNSKIRAKPYLQWKIKIRTNVIFVCTGSKDSEELKCFGSGVAWLSTVRVVKCLINFLNERNACSVLYYLRGGSQEKVC